MIVTASVAADILGVNVETLRSWIKRRIYEIPEHQGGWVRYGLDDLTALATIVALNKIGLEVNVAAAMIKHGEYRRAIQLADEALDAHAERENVSLAVNYCSESSEFEAQVCDPSATIGAVVDTDAAAVLNVTKIRRRIRKCYSERKLVYGLTERAFQVARLGSSSLLSAPKVIRKRR